MLLDVNLKGLMMQVRTLNQQMSLLLTGNHLMPSNTDCIQMAVGCSASATADFHKR